MERTSEILVSALGRFSAKLSINSLLVIASLFCQPLPPPVPPMPYGNGTPELHQIPSLAPHQSACSRSRSHLNCCDYDTTREATGAFALNQAHEVSA